MSKDNDILNFPPPSVLTKNKVVLRRPTFESEITVTVDNEDRREIESDCSLHFMNHMLEHLSARSCLNFKVEIGLPRYKLTHVITEDLGITLGRAVLHLLVQNIGDGINTYGESSGVLDEALAKSIISVEGRPGYYLDSPKKIKYDELVEDMQSKDVETFIEGFAQGLLATIHVDILKGRNPHHIWEAVFRALGESLRQVFAPCPWRKDIIAAIKRTLY